MLAMHFKKSDPSAHYYWKIFDVHHKGYITVWHINYFFRVSDCRILSLCQDILKKLKEKGLSPVHVEDVAVGCEHLPSTQCLPGRAIRYGQTRAPPPYSITGSQAGQSSPHILLYPH